MNEDNENIGFKYAILLPNILQKNVKVIVDESPEPLFYSRVEFVDLIIKYGFTDIAPLIREALIRTQSVLWDVEKKTLTSLSYRSEPDSILKDLLAEKERNRKKVDDRPLTEKFSRSEIDISDPENPIISLF